MSQDVVEVLEQNLPNMNGWAANVAQDLINTWNNGKMWNGRRIPAHRDFTDNQVALVRKLIAAAQPAEDSTIDVGDYHRVVAMFESARNHKLKWPKIELSAGGVKLRLYMATERSRNPGHIQVQLADSRSFLGNVSPSGAFSVYRNGVEFMDSVVSVLRHFGNDPIRVAAAYGKKTGNCCFCRKPLGEGEDQRSVVVGYGPVCANKWGLPWGGQA